MHSTIDLLQYALIQRNSHISSLSSRDALIQYQTDLMFNTETHLINDSCRVSL